TADGSCASPPSATTCRRRATPPTRPARGSVGQAPSTVAISAIAPSRANAPRAGNAAAMPDDGILRAARVMRAGGVVAYPAEACFGLGCNPRDRGAVYRILALKRRRVEQGLIMLAASLTQLREYLDAAAMDLMDAPRETWPGPVTWLLPASRWAPRWITGGRDTIAVRVTAMPLAARLCDAYGGAIVSTSANPRGMPPARTFAQVRFYFGRRLDDVVRARIAGLARPSEIRDAATGAVLRHG